MKLFRCIICGGEVEIIDAVESSINKKVKCLKCGFTNVNEHQQKKSKDPEIIIIKRKFN